VSKPRKKLKGRPATDARGNATWKWGGEGETEVETALIRALGEGLSLESSPEKVVVHSRALESLACAVPREPTGAEDHYLPVHQLPDQIATLTHLCDGRSGIDQSGIEIGRPRVSVEWVHGCEYQWVLLRPARLHKQNRHRTLADEFPVGVRQDQVLSYAFCGGRLWITASGIGLHDGVKEFDTRP
jgi:hypothetical protein